MPIPFVGYRLSLDGLVMMDDKPGSMTGRIAGHAVRLAFGLFLTSLVAVLFLRFVPPVFSAFMAGRYLQGLFVSGKQTEITYHWADWKEISPWMALAVVAAEDQKFPKHHGFDFESIADAMEEIGKGTRFRGASTISQQVARNLFLWKGKSFIRKGLEAYVTVLIELLWPKRRILEMYLNVAEFGDGLYGAKSASKKFFGKHSSELTKKESALLAAVLPNPVRFNAGAPSAYVRQRTLGIEKQMGNLGPSYLKGIWSEY
ncbi:MAG: monofunctional biosynthetic peptidoglycan transglycosylase [Desulfatirhabdiaceae bacterium]